jgi:AraC family transcriptional regulator
MEKTRVLIIQQRRLRKVIDYIDAHIEGDITLAGMADIACLSRFHFVRAFKAHTGVTPCQYVSQLRIEHAKLLLRARERSLADIADALRFSSQSTFTRAFRKATGLTPLQYATFHGLAARQPASPSLTPPHAVPKRCVAR